MVALLTAPSLSSAHAGVHTATSGCVARGFDDGCLSPWTCRVVRSALTGDGSVSSHPKGLVRQMGSGQVFSMTLNDLLAQILQLPPDQRMQLIADIWDSLDPATAAPLTPALVAELSRREAEADADPSAGISWTDIKRELQAKLL